MGAVVCQALARHWGETQATAQTGKWLSIVAWQSEKGALSKPERTLLLRSLTLGSSSVSLDLVCETGMPGGVRLSEAVL